MMLLSYANNFFGYGYGYRGLYFDPTMILALLGLILTMIASAGVNSTFAKYNKVRCMRGMTGAEAAQQVLHAAGIFDVQIRHVRGNLTDHYDPRNKTLNLSDSTFSSNSVAAVCVAAHECGHAVQHARGYAPLTLRSQLVPIVQFSSTAATWVIILGLVILATTQNELLCWIGVGLIAMSAVFSLVTLPVEYNASARALEWLQVSRTMQGAQLAQAREALSWAARTYLVAALSAIASVLYYVFLILGRRD